MKVRADTTVMPSFRVELHSHCKGDPVDSYLGHTLFQHIDRAKEVGLDVIAVTWHRRICSDPEAFAYAKERGVLVIPGMEADVDGQFHLVVLNLAEGDLPSAPTWAQVRALRARKPEVLVMAPHPFYPHPTCLGREMNEHADCIDAVEWCALHVNWLPGRVNPNLRAARWAHKHGKTLIACSDAHTLCAIAKNASTVEADELTIDSILAGIRAGHVAFHRRSLDLGPLLYATGKAMSSQPRHIGRWMQGKLNGRSRYPKTAAGFEIQS
jgi:predicted metal-dependent phosphoesterase TrpH